MSAFNITPQTANHIYTALIHGLGRSTSQTLAERVATGAQCRRALDANPCAGAREIAVVIMHDWLAANALAVGSRYRETPQPLDPGQRFIDTLPHTSQAQMVKAMQCLRYQCHEDVAADKQAAHEETLKQMDQALLSLALATISSQQAYELASWG